MAQHLHRLPIMRQTAPSAVPPYDAIVEPNGQEYLITVPGGAVFVALTLAEANAVARLWRLREGVTEDRTGTTR